MSDISEHPHQPEPFRLCPFDGSDMPDAVIDWNLGTNKAARASFEDMY